MSEPINKEFYDKYGMCEKCFYDWDAPCSCWEYRETKSLDKEMKRIDAYLANEKRRKITGDSVENG
jgi:hypothetical protein